MRALPPVPASIGKYRIERELGRGASGAVYLGVDSLRKRKVAVKQMHAHLLVDPAQADRHRRQWQGEAVLATQLDHPHIVRLLDADVSAAQPYLVLEYIAGQPLSKHAGASTLLTLDQVLDIAFKCANALEYAERQGVVHRDIKPDNILLTEDGNVKLVDFGAALSLRSEVTQPAGLVGSPAYMSPEQVREEPLTHHSDMFSLGVVLYELLTGRRPFDGESDYATLYRIGHDAPLAPALLRASLPAEVDGFVLRALAKTPAERYPRWVDFAGAVLALSRNLPRQKSQDTEAERFSCLRALPFFTDFHDVALWELMRLGRWHRVPAGTLLMREDAKGDSFCILVEGQVDISRKKRALCTLEPGVTFGEMTYLRPEAPRRTATATAATNAIVLKVRSPALRGASSTLQACFDKVFIGLLVGRLVATNAQVAEWNAGLGEVER